MNKLLLGFLIFISCISCHKELKITESKDIIKRETKNILVNIKISNFTSNIDKTKAELSAFNILRNVELNKYADTLENEANSLLKELSTSEQGRPSWKYSIYVEDTILSMNPLGIISLLQTECVFTGGAHPNTITKSYNYSLVYHKLLKKEDILGSTHPENLNKLLLESFTKHNKYNIELFEKPTLELADAIGVTKDQIIFVYNRYTLACYAVGDIKIKIDKSKLIDFLKI